MVTNGRSEQPKLVDILISRGTVLTMDPARRVIEDGSVAVHEREDRRRWASRRGRTCLPGTKDA